MGMFTDRPVGKLWWADDKATLREVSMMSWGANRVYSSGETLTLTDTAARSARQQVLDELYERGIDARTVTEIPFDIDARAVTNLNGMLRDMPSLLVAPRVKGSAAATDMSYMFTGCSSLVSVPAMNTSSVTNMRAMFNGCSSLVDVPAMDTGQVTNMRSMFNSCSSLVTVPAMDTSRVTEMSYVFNGCSSLVSVPDTDTGRATTMRSMFNGCSSLVAVPAMNTSAVTDMSFMFRICRLLTSVPEFDVSSLTAAASMFVDCDLIERAPLRGLATSLDLSSTSFTPSGADELMGLVRDASGRTLTFPESAWGCDPRIAEDKRWQVDTPGTVYERVTGWGLVSTPDWATAIDVVAIGGGNSGYYGDSGVLTKSHGYGGNAGKWASSSYAVQVGDRVRFEPGDGYADDRGGDGGEASTVKINDQLVFTAAGGVGRTGVRYTSEGAGNYTAFGRTFIGGKSVGEGQDGEAPGGGGGGGRGQDFAVGRGGKGGDGMTWVRFRGGGV